MNLGMSRLGLSALAVGLTLTAWPVFAQSLPVAPPESVGLSSKRLERVHQGMQGFVTRNEVAGIVTLIARDGKIADLRAFGSADLEAKRPMTTNTIFRIASMTKPITSVAIMMLVEDGRISLTDPVARFIPAFKESRVLAKGGPDANATEPVRRPMTVRDLLTHRSGLSYGFADTSAVGDYYRREGVSDGLTITAGTIAENVDRLARAPLVSQPGAEWHYSLGIDVLGRIVEVASGMPFDAFLNERIFTPLKMVDTAFYVPEEKWSRFAGAYTADGNGGIRAMKDPESFTNTHMSPYTFYKAPKRYFSGGAGLVSTASDYVRFAQMLLNGGELDGVRLLSPKTIELMARSHTTDLPGGQGGLGSDFGLGFRVVTDLGESQSLGSEGMYGWSGIYGTNFWIDPKEKLVGIMMVQRYPGAPVAPAFQTLTYQSIIGPPQSQTRGMGAGMTGRRARVPMPSPEPAPAVR